jgi:hypothetical protein
MDLDNDYGDELASRLDDFAADAKFRSSVLALQKTPFSSPETREFISLEEAREPRRLWPQAVLAGFAIFILLYLLSPFLGQIRPDLLDLLQRKISGGLPPATSHSFPWWQWTIVFCVVIGACIYAGQVLFKVPAKIPDPLFGRLLQAGLKELMPLSSTVILHILQDRRFTAVLERACDLTLPESDSSTRWKPFVVRLADALSGDERFQELLQSRPARPVPESIDTHSIDEAITRYLIYTTRKMLFDTVVADPDLRYIYEGIAPWHRGLIKWMAKIDFSKAKDLFGKRDEKGAPHGADIQGIANVALVVLVIVLLKGWATPAPSEPGKEDDKEIARLRDDLKDLRDLVLRSLIESCKATPAQLVCPAPGAIHIALPKSEPPVVNVPSPIVNVPAPTINVPSKLSVEVTSTSTTSAEKLVLQPKGEPSHEQTTGGDTFLTLGPDAPKDASSKLLVDEGKGVTCSYDAALVTQSPWPPDPVEVKVSNADPQNAATCPKLDGPQPERNVVYASTKPLYNGPLSAYVSVKEMHRKWMGVGKEFVVLHIHAQSVP